MNNSDIERMEKAGLTTAMLQLRKLREQKQKMTIAYKHYRFVKPEKFQAFNERLKKETLKDYTYSRLKFTELAKYEKVPPMHVIDKLEEANARACFDKYEVASIESVTELPDPIIFGIIDGCSDKFFIDQWDSDVKKDDLG